MGRQTPMCLGKVPNTGKRSNELDLSSYVGDRESLFDRTARNSELGDGGRASPMLIEVGGHRSPFLSEEVDLE